MGRREMLLAGLTAGAGLVLAPGRAGAATPVPVQFVESARGWGARPPSAPARIWDRRPIRILVHHTAGPNQPDVSRDAAHRMARGIQNDHMDRNGWLDSGQHFTVSRGGFVLEGRVPSLGELNEGRRQVEGAHCVGQNVVAIGIENEGTYTSTVPPGALWDALRALCAYVCVRYGIAPTAIDGHRDHRNTLCPGDRLYALLPRLRTEVGGLLGRAVSRAEARRASWPLLRAGDSGPEVVAAQWLLRDAGALRQAPTGRYDAVTVEAVRDFQRATDAEDANGLLGGESWPVLARTVRRVDGDAGRAVRVLAEHRRAEGLPDVVDAPVWQHLLGTGGTAADPAADPPGVANR